MGGAAKDASRANGLTLRPHQVRAFLVEEGGRAYRLCNFGNDCVVTTLVGGCVRACTHACACMCMRVRVRLNAIIGLCSLHLQLRDTRAKMMDLLINIFIHFKI